MILDLFYVAINSNYKSTTENAKFYRSNRKQLFKNDHKTNGTPPVTDSKRMNKGNVDLSDIILLISRLSRFCQIFGASQANRKLYGG